MVLRLACATIVAAVLLSVLCLSTNSAVAADPADTASGSVSTTPDPIGTAGVPAASPYVNYYVAPVYAGGVGAQLYPCPRPTPMRVGQTYITYQALAPSEFLYRHARTYYRYHPSGQITRTRVEWR